MGPDALIKQKGGKYLEEKAIEEVFEAYEDIWDIEKFGGDYSKRHAFARDFINAQTKKYRSDRSKEQNKVAAAVKRAEATAKRAQARPRPLPCTRLEGISAPESKRHPLANTRPPLSNIHPLEVQSPSSHLPHTARLHRPRKGEKAS